MSDAELCFTSATDLGRAIRSREVSPVEVLEAVLRRIDILNPLINAYLTVTADLAREQARAAEARARRGEMIGPLDGVPYSLKDMEPTAGIRTTYGSKFLEHNVPAEDGVVAQRMKATGAVLLGKTNTPHFGYKDMGDNLLGPPCRNPWNLERTSGGSSAGAAAGVAAGLGPIGMGSDGGGSIRIPAALCGVFGLKPSFGRIPSYPSLDYWAALGHKGPLTRTVRDAALVLTALAGPDHRDPTCLDGPSEDYVAACRGDLRGLRVAWSADLGYAPVDPEVKAIAAAAARRFEEFGCIVEAKDPQWTDPAPGFKVFYAGFVAPMIVDRASARPDWIEPSLMRMIDEARAISGIEMAKARAQRTQFYEQARRFFGDYDLLLTPQMPVAAWSVEPGLREGPQVIAGRATPSLFDHLPFTFPFNMTGQPAASVPCGFTSEGLPVALQIVGRWHADATVLRASACLEAAQPWAQHRPEVGG